MSITLSHGSTLVELSDRLQWTNEYEWSPIQQSTEYTIGGALVVDQGLKLAGRPIFLEGEETKAWITRVQCEAIQSLNAAPQIVMTLVLRSEEHQVIFDRANGGFNARPVWKLLDGEITGELFYVPTLRFLTV